jgi:hypothetical protein
LGELLKSPGASHMLLTPQATPNKATPLSAVITSPSYMLEAQADYFPAGENTPTFGKAQPENKHGLVSSPALPAAARGSVRASIIEPTTRTRSSSIPNPAFTSHPAVMAMATPPAELPAPLTPEETLQPSDAGFRSAPSSIGEPGPEMADTETTRSVSVSEQRILVEESGITVSVVPASAEEETFAAAAAAAAKKVEQAQSIATSQSGGLDQSAQESLSPKQEESPRILEQIPEVPTNSPPPPPAESDATNVGYANDEEVDIIIHMSESDVPKEQFFAELEASTPVRMQANKDFGPVELEAPHQTFKLPPRPIAASSNPDKEVPRASIRQLDDFFKLPTEQSIKPGMKPKDFGDSRTPEPIRPLKLKLAKKDGKVVPVPVGVSSPANGKMRESPGPSKLRMDVVADIIETMSNTPPGSPIQDNRSSSASANSAQRWSQRSTRSLGPPDQAPAPPGPGGRQMVNPDFAAAGQFEGERKRKQKKKSSGFVNINKEKWKNLFLNNGSSTNTSSSSGASMATRSEKTTSTTRPSSEAVPAAEMMTGSGKDVLWFKGESKKSLGVSSA